MIYWIRYGLPIGTLFTALTFIFFIDFHEGEKIKFDQEHLDVNGNVINPSTQSLNRYYSVLRDMKRVDVEFSEQTKRISMVIRSENADNEDKKIYLNHIDAGFLIPLLPYAHDSELDNFDKANLMLAEYARNGIQLSYQQSNSLYGYFNSKDGLFSNAVEEYHYRNGLIQPKPDLQPTRFSVTNNCLKPGLWEFNATDSVGEMYHSWFDFPKDTYYRMIRSINGIESSDFALYLTLRYQKDLSNVELQLEKLRTKQDTILTVKPTVVLNKPIAGYSTQDSRRKVQKGYFKIIRDEQQLEKKYVSELKKGDVFQVKRFVAPGVYSETQSEEIPFSSDWNFAAISSVVPKTSYTAKNNFKNKNEYIEIFIYKGDGDRGIVLGNIPVDLLVAQEDYEISAFGVGIFPPMESIERRYLRYHQGPIPHYAYEVQKKEGKWVLVNNHETGYEQVFLRPFERDGKWYLRVNIVSYERIVDLVELELPIGGILQKKIVNATDAYVPPLFRVYEDINIL
ncbi:hypothetical protein [Microbulbifer spongiae]|uniref:Uncharacterized protein n=1 Tax=Microbulbifer spongiae TaxID=2944933 RepID=A0ABY9EG99_9GAMM|nr:hypothetical protein [Microbulbifer sp. MI-G]WKD51565.1 hypothetical protein M8T91_09130 [Microbulbifer sp. MI-G]